MRNTTAVTGGINIAVKLIAVYLRCECPSVAFTISMEERESYYYFVLSLTPDEI
jgi:hypothetical protein